MTKYSVGLYVTFIVPVEFTYEAENASLAEAQARSEALDEDSEIRNKINRKLDWIAGTNKAPDEVTVTHVELLKEP